MSDSSENNKEPRRSSATGRIGGQSSLRQAGFTGNIQIDDLWDAFDDEGDEGQPFHSFGLHKTVEQTLSDFSGDNKYVILDEMAKGGMGKILRAVDRDIHRPVAMKVIIGRADEEQRARFVEEAQITGQLEHPNIVPVHELGIDPEGNIYFSMKLMKGDSLSDILDKIRDCGGDSKEFSIRYLIRILLAAANAIAYAHSKGVVHRDLKPGNIMVGDYGEVLVMDWGLAKIGATREFRKKDAKSRGEEYREPEAPEPAMLPPSTRDRDANLDDRVRSYRHDSSLMITKDGTVAGTPAYMSPEQARGEIDHIDERSDIYSLGAILYEIVTLFPPVMGDSDSEFLDRVKAGQIMAPTIRSPRGEIPQRVADIAMKALSFAPKERYQNVGEFRQALIDFLESGEGIPAKQKPESTISFREVEHKSVPIHILVAILALSAFVYGLMARSINIANEKLERAELEKDQALLERDKAVRSLREYRLEGFMNPGQSIEDLIGIPENPPKSRRDTYGGGLKVSPPPIEGED
ncbi:MAG: serine/threonine protein kinase [Planctomycetes bacterium]|nr:serine/threonine protein kinase [Planctomycetota bacterium]